MRVVEIGPSSMPVFNYSSEVEKRLDEGAMYVGIDVVFDRAAWAKKSIRKEWHATSVTGDLARIPLANNFANEVWLLNVFGGPSESRLEKLSYGTLRWTMGIGRGLNECVRVLKPGGTIFIGEWYARVGNIGWMTEADYSEYGLSKKVYSGKSFYKFVKRHGIRIYATDEDTPPFFIALTKKA